MSKQKYFLFINIVFALILIFIVYTFFTSFFKSYQLDSSEIEGVNKIDTLLNIEITLQRLRGLIQIRSSHTEIPDLISLEKKHLEFDTKQLSPSAYKNTLNDFVLRKHLTLHFDDFTSMIHKTLDEIFNQAQEYNLLFDPMPKSYFLMSVLVFEAPYALENLSLIRGLGSKILRSKKLTEESPLILNNSLKNYSYSLKKIERLVDKFPESTKLGATLLILKEKTTIISNITNKLLSGEITMQDYDFFQTISKHIDILHILIKQNKIDLLDVLEHRKDRNFLLFVLSLFTFIVATIILIASLITRNKKTKYERAINEAKKYKEFSIESLKETLYHVDNLLDTSTQALKFFTLELHAQTGVLYLYDITNQKLNLGATVGISSSILKHAISVDDGLIGKAFKSKEKQELRLSQKTAINLNLCSVTPSQIIALPLIIYDTVVGVIQLAFIEDQDLDDDYLDYLSEITANSIKRTQDDEKKIRLLNIIDKNVITSSTNKMGQITYVSDTFASISGYAKEELIGQNHNMVRHPDMNTELFADMWQTISLGRIWRGELKNRTKRGGFYWVDVSITPDFDFYGNITGYTAVRQDITDKKTIEELSITDALTGIYNRRYFEKIFTQRLLAARRDKKDLVFIIIDIDHFKQYNDTYGHPKGDTALIKVAQTLNEQLKRPGDFAFRIGGEEFGILFEANNLTDSKEFGNNIKDRIEQLHIIHESNSASKFVTISMGMFYFDHLTSYQNEEEAYKNADTALYKAKETGRNRLEIWVDDESVL